MKVYDEQGNNVAAPHGYTKPVAIGQIPAYDGSFESDEVVTRLQAVVKVLPDGTVTVQISGSSLWSTLLEMEEG